MPNLHCEAITFPSSDGKHTSSAFLYTVPGQPVRAVLQLSHGMCEYVRRYAPMAEFYAAHGIALAGNDHLGHGDTAQAGEHGHYGEPNGRCHLLNDLHTMNRILHERFPDTPIILYGHSMGSFYARWYAEKWPESITALVISGTAGPSFMNVVGQRLAGLIARVKGPRYVSPLMVKLNFGSYCRKIENAQSPNAWLSRDKSVVKAYDADGLCTFRFTAATYREMLATLEAPAYLERVTVNNVKNVKNAKKAIEKAFRYQVEGKGFSLIEVLSACPTNWGLTPQKALEWIDEKMIPYYPLGVYRDKEG